MNILKLIDHPELLNAKIPDHDLLQAIGHALLSSYILVAVHVHSPVDTNTPIYTPHLFRLTELEFYIGSKVHEDPFSHNHKVQYKFGKWYLHPSGGSRKGIDLTFGRSNETLDNVTGVSVEPSSTTPITVAAGAVLIRGLQHLSLPSQDTSSLNDTTLTLREVVWGPSKCVDALMHCLQVTVLADFKALVHDHTIDLTTLFSTKPSSTSDTHKSVIGFVHASQIDLLLQTLPSYRSSSPTLISNMNVSPSSSSPPAAKRRKQNKVATTTTLVATASPVSITEGEQIKCDYLSVLTVNVDDMLMSPRVGIFPKPVPPVLDNVVKGKSKRMGRARGPPANLFTQLNFIFDLYRFSIFSRQNSKGRAQLFLGAMIAAMSTESITNTEITRSNEDEEVKSVKHITMPQDLTIINDLNPQKLVTLFSIDKQRVRSILGWKEYDVDRFVECVELGVMEYCEGVVKCKSTDEARREYELLAPFCYDLTASTVEKWSRLYGAYVARKQHLKSSINYPII